MVAKRLDGPDVLASQKVVCFSDNAPSFYARQPEFHAVRPFVDRWIARSRQAVREFSALGVRAELAPYCADPKVFSELPREHAELRALRQRLGLPADAYLIGNFHSDTAFTLGPDCPKWQKGPDVFAEIVRRVRETEPRVSVLLAGPRRHWLRRRLRALGVPVFFVGRESEGDDFGVNILSRAELNRLYNLLDLCLVTSRWEGGPHTLIEACFAKTKILSTRVGIAEDVLDPKSLFDTIPEAVSRILEDARDQTLEPTREPQYRRVLEQNTPEKLASPASSLRRSSSGPAENNSRSGERLAPRAGHRASPPCAAAPSCGGDRSPENPRGGFSIFFAKHCVSPPQSCSGTRSPATANRIWPMKAGCHQIRQRRRAIAKS